jgi:hypothetical protein
MSFPCQFCGLCCRSLNKEMMPELYIDNPVCRHLDVISNACMIYHNRPLVCRIDESWENIYFTMYSRQVFYNLNLDGCINLARLAKRRDLEQKLHFIKTNSAQRKET